MLLQSFYLSSTIEKFRKSFSYKMHFLVDFFFQKQEITIYDEHLTSFHGNKSSRTFRNASTSITHDGKFRLIFKENIC